MIVLWVVNRLEPLVGRPVHWLKRSIHSHRSALSQGPFFIGKEVSEVGEFGHGEAVLLRPRAGTVALVVHQGRKIVVEDSTQADPR